MTEKPSARRWRLLAPFHHEKGQAAFEFMLILPFFIGFILLLVDLGILAFEYVSVSNAAREAARYGSVNCDDGSCDLSQVVNLALKRSAGILSNPAEVTAGWLDNNNDGENSARGDSVVVKVTHPYHFLFFPGVSIDVVSCADMRLERTDETTGLPSGSGCN
jgi:Flp pilus assembly protein TadG